LGLLLIVGKDKVKLLKVHKDAKDPKKQSVVELTVQILLEGAIETSYTKADNSVVVATDSMKNTVYCIAPCVF
jgi:urate oxidase